MPVTQMETPGVYIQEVNAFPNSVVAVDTAVPAFVGYTPRASYKGKSLKLVPTEISSLQDFLTYFGVLNTDTPPSPAAGISQYSPVYYPSALKSGEGDVEIDGVQYDLIPDPSTLYNLYTAIQLFYENGGGTAYVVSVGGYGPVAGAAAKTAAPYTNPNVTYADLYAGLQALENQQEPTMIVIPDAVLLDEKNYATLTQNMLAQAGEMESRVAIIDVYGGGHPDPLQWPQAIADFRTATGMQFLDYGAAYFPFLETTIVQDGDINYKNLGGAAALQGLPFLSSGVPKTIISGILKPPATNAPTALQNEQALLNASQGYSQLHDIVLAKMNTLPPAAAMAGVYTLTDTQRGVWAAPANVSLTAVTNTTLKLTDNTQQQLNVDAATGKSVNAIRVFPGKGTLVWGARTLDGNSLDWRYISVRRTMIMIEQSLKLALKSYVFESNNENTWSLVASETSDFLTSLWKQGALAGATPADAFSVAIGLGKTMTGTDILNGIMRLSVQVAVTHPAEFIVVQISQQMQKS